MVNCPHPISLFPCLLGSWWSPPLPLQRQLGIKQVKLTNQTNQAHHRLHFLLSFFFFNTSSHHPISRNCLEIMLQFGGLQCHRNIYENWNWIGKNRSGKEKRKINRNEELAWRWTVTVQCINYFGVSSQTNAATITVPGAEPVFIKWVNSVIQLNHKHNHTISTYGSQAFQPFTC